MELLRRYRDPALVRRLSAALNERALPRPLRFLHVCGTHENAIGRFGLRDLLPEGLRLVAGPGCPVCICPPADIDLAVRVAADHGAVLATFGDVVRVPARRSLAEARAQGADVRVVYGPDDAARIAAAEPEREVVFFAVGFETTACAVAAVLAADPPPNLSVIVSHRLIPPALNALLDADDIAVDGYLLPGHVLTVAGTEDYGRFAAERGLPLAVAGFEPADILAALLQLVDRTLAGEFVLDNRYRRAVRPEGNPRARAAMARVFRPVDAAWRGLGTIPASGFALAPAYAERDALTRFGLAPDPTLADFEVGCACGAVLRGQLDPPACPLFRGRCMPESPVGPCMVSGEGTCRAWYRYGPAPGQEAT